MPLLWGCTLALLTAGVSLSLLLFTYVRAWESRGLQAEISNRAAERVEILRNKIYASMDVLRSIDSLFATRGAVSRQEFERFVAPALVRQPELKALGWTPRVSASARGQYEAMAQRDGLKGFQFVERGPHGEVIRTGNRPEYFPVYYLEPVTSNSAALGYELDSSPVRRDTLRRAWQTDQPAATPPLRLIQGDDHDPGFIVYLPLYAGGAHPAPADRGPLLIGFASAVFTVDDLLAPCVSDLPRQGLGVTIEDSDVPQAAIYRLPTDTSDSVAALAASASLDVAGQHWTLILEPTEQFVAARHTLHADLILGTSLLITLLLCICVAGGLMQTARVERRVIDRTSELSREVAERKRAEEAAHIAEAKYRGIVENTIEGIFQTSLEGHYLSANPALARIYGYASPKELIARLPNIANQLYVQPGRRDEFIHQVQRDGIVSGFESKVRRHDGTVIWISENARAVRGALGQVLYYEGTVIDITARKEAEESLRRARAELETRVQERTRELGLSNEALQAEIAVRQRAEQEAAAANRAKTEFLAQMSHEIRTPMNAILGYAQILQRDSSLPGRHREAIDTVMSSGKHLLALIDDVLDLSKIEAGRDELEPTDFNLGLLMEGVINMFRARCAQCRIQLLADVHPDCHAIVHGDERKLRQVLVNLVGNAVKFTDEGWVKLCGRREAADVYRFEVIDTGAGIPADAMPLVFEAFRQGSAGRSRGGTGLGLPIARHQVQMMGGQLSVISADGEGSRFYFSIKLPASSRHGLVPGRAGDWESVSLAPGSSVRALVVDDLEENRTVLAEILSGIGCDVTTAASGEEALRMAQASQFDIAFIDILMPGLSGMETAARLRGGSTKLVAVTASAFAHEQERWLAAGFDDLILKPVLCQRVYLSLGQLLQVQFYRNPDEGGTPQPSAPAVNGDADDAPVTTGLSVELRRRILAAAEVHGITALKQCIDDAERTSPAMRRLCDQLRRSLHAYDMNQIIELLSGEQANPDGAAVGFSPQYSQRGAEADG
jgi:PAS domain S-box-containing protein